MYFDVITNKTSIDPLKNLYRINTNKKTKIFKKLVDYIKTDFLFYLDYYGIIDLYNEQIK